MIGIIIILAGVGMWRWKSKTNL